MIFTNFDIVYSVIYSFVFAFIISIFPFGIMLYKKIVHNDLPDQTLCQTVLIFLFVLVWFTSFNVSRLYMNDCHFSCVFIYDPVYFPKCCENGGWALF